MTTNYSNILGASSYDGSVRLEHARKTSAVHPSRDTGLSDTTKQASLKASTANDISLPNIAGLHLHSNDDINDRLGAHGNINNPSVNQTSISSSTPNVTIHRHTPHYTNSPPNPSPSDNHHTNYSTSLPYTTNHNQTIYQPSIPLSTNVPYHINHPYHYHYPPTYTEYYPSSAEVYLPQHIYETVNHHTYHRSAHYPYSYPSNTARANSENFFTNENLTKKFYHCVHEFTIYLTHAGLKDLIPNHKGHTLREPTPVEQHYITYTFFHGIPSFYYPEWFNNWIANPSCQYDAILYAIMQVAQQTECSNNIKPPHVSKYNSKHNHIQPPCNADNTNTSPTNTTLGGTTMNTPLPLHTHNNTSSINNHTTTSSITTTEPTTSNTPNIIIIEKPDLSYSDNSSTISSSIQNHFNDNSTLGGIQYSDSKKDCQHIKSNKNIKVAIGQIKNIKVINYINNCDNNGIKQEYKEYKLVNISPTALFNRSPKFYNTWINDKIKKNPWYHLLIHPHRFRRKNIIHMI